MRKTTTLLIAAAMGVLGAGQAAAADRLSDVAYLSAMRCRGLAEARQIDAGSLDAMLKVQKRQRATYIAERGSELRRVGVRDGRSADLSRKARVDTELSGACQAYLSGAPV